jgi:RNA polymerase sigma factor (sigma-70 family)
MSDSPTPYTSRSDERLFADWAAGDPRAGEHLFRRHFDALMRFFRRQVGDDVEDLVQQTFMGCIQARARHPVVNNFRAFLFRIARNSLYKRFRARSGRPLQQISVSSVVDIQPSPSRLLGERQETALLVEALTHLPLEQQLALYFYYLEEMSASQVSEALGGLPVPAVRSRLRRGLERLRERLAADARRPDVAATLERWSAALPLLADGEREPERDDPHPPDERDLA